MVADDPPAKADQMVAELKARKAEWGMEDADIAKVCAWVDACGLLLGGSAAARESLELCAAGQSGWAGSRHSLWR